FFVSRDGIALAAEGGYELLGGLGGGEGGDLNIKGAGSLMGGGAHGWFGFGEFFFNLGEGLVGGFPFSEALLGEAGAVEDPGFKIAGIELVVSRRPVDFGGAEVVHPVADVAEAGAGVGF